MNPDPGSHAVLLAHIRQCIRRIREYTREGRSAFFDSCLVQDAVLRNLQTLAESTQRLSSELKATESALPWPAIAGFRNVLAHGYLALDLEAVWSVVERDLPELGDAVDRMLARTAASGSRAGSGGRER